MLLQVTYRFRDSETRKLTLRTVSGATFLWLVLQHVLPKGFRRSRNFGFLHPNYWVRFFVRWHGRDGKMRHPRDMGGAEVTEFLTMLANERRVSVSTHNQNRETEQETEQGQVLY